MQKKEQVEKEMVQKLDGVELRTGYYVPQGQPNSNMIQLDHPSDVRRWQVGVLERPRGSAVWRSLAG